MDKFFTVTIRLGNDAMQTQEDVARALRTVAAKLDTGETEGKIRDDNGNTVGEFKFNAEL